ncbi:hypothetical protein EVAR_54925_1 [Eumeta japonica]|uniref:Uncharacterized protein n=1 Tax=Eumeta variegata TaxID=151549 RepID=A0A4C1YEB2_EUMVA|nr:hypothetical protein EVAR_54925_1 [Eumeta japonica]
MVFYEFLSNECRRSFVELHMPLCKLLNEEAYLGGMLVTQIQAKNCPYPPSHQRIWSGISRKHLMAFLHKRSAAAFWSFRYRKSCAAAAGDDANRIYKVVPMCDSSTLAITHDIPEAENNGAGNDFGYHSLTISALIREGREPEQIINIRGGSKTTAPAAPPINNVNSTPSPKILYCRMWDFQFRFIQADQIRVLDCHRPLPRAVMPTFAPTTLAIPLANPFPIRK